jgi:hypothetical protein
MTTRELEELAYPYDGDTTADFANRSFAPNDKHWSQNMVQCPCCNSGTLQSNRFENMPFNNVARGALDARQAGKGAHAFTALAVWAGVEALNRMRAEWKCSSCGAVF